MDPSVFVAVAAALLGVLVITPILLWRQLRATSRRAQEAEQDLTTLRAKFAPVLDADEEARSIRNRVAAEVADAERRVSEAGSKVETLRASYREKRVTYDRLVSEIAIFDERLAFAEMGVYEPHFEFDDSEAYKAAIVAIRERQKEMVSAKTAVESKTEWTVEGSKAKGKTMSNRSVRLTLRAFNNECDAAIANTRWNNVNAMEKRIVRAEEQIDKLNESLTVEINPRYVRLKLDELFLTHEYREKLKNEREERAEMARAAREEQRLLRDMEQAQEDEEHYAKLLEKAKTEAASIVGTKLDAFEDQIKTLEKDLSDAHARFERAQAMAERTRSGYVYVISNIGSFGEGVVKIGLTRRLDPLDRVRELGDASVPFVFDTHAVIYSDDAPALERALHAEFEPGRINVQNFRKEFFRASIDDVEDAVKRLAPDAPFFKDIEAQEYRETLSRRSQALLATEPAVAHFPDDI